MERQTVANLLKRREIKTLSKIAYRDFVPKPPDEKSVAERFERSLVDFITKHQRECPTASVWAVVVTTSFGSSQTFRIERWRS